MLHRKGNVIIVHHVTQLYINNSSTMTVKKKINTDFPKTDKITFWGGWEERDRGTERERETERV